MRKLLLAVAGLTVAAGIAVPTVASATVADSHTCYTLGVPGQNHYEYCTNLPVDPNDILR